MEKTVIKQVLLEQRKEIDRILVQKVIERETISRKQFPLSDPHSELIAVIMGVRRSGKSVLAHLLLKDKNYGYVNFDDERLIGVKTEDLNDFFEVIKQIDPEVKHILLDEIQNVYGWELFVNRLKRLGYNLIITGSNSNLLSKELATHLTGRHVSVELFPFSFREFLNLKNKNFSADDLRVTEKKGEIKHLLDEYVKYGGFPEVIKMETSETKIQYLKDLYDRIITRDVISRFSVRYVKDLKEIAYYLISNFSSRISYNKIKNMFNIKSVHTVKNYVGYLEECYLIVQLSAFSFKAKNRIMQPKKIYAIDVGMTNAVTTGFSPDFGRIMENLVFLELLRRKQDEQLFFYSDAHQHEVDFVIKRGLGIEQIIQVCHSVEDVETKKREIRSAITASETLKCDNILIITGDYDNEEDAKWQNVKRRIRFVPMWKWLLLR